MEKLTAPMLKVICSAHKVSGACVSYANCLFMRDVAHGIPFDETRELIYHYKFCVAHAKGLRAPTPPTRRARNPLACATQNW